MKSLLKLFVAAALAVGIANANDVYGSKHYTESMKKYLISAEDAVKLIGKKGVVFVSGDDHDAYEGVGHVIGSVEMGAHHLHHADITGHLHCAPLFMCIDEAEEYISGKGINNGDLIIAYDNFRGPNATGVWTYFKSFGHDNIKILNGGMDAIKAIDPAVIESKKYRAIANDYKKQYKKVAKTEGKKSATYKKLKAEYKAMKKKEKNALKDSIIQKGKEKIAKKGNYKIDPKKINMDVIVSKEDMKKAMKDILAKGKDSKYRIIDTRGMAEIIGLDKKDNVARGGHIPGSTFIEWKNFTDFDNKLSYVDLKKVQKVFDKYGIKKDQTIYAYCHVGAGRSTHIQVALKMLGYKNVKAYSGSWDEWGNDMNLPIYK